MELAHISQSQYKLSLQERICDVDLGVLILDGPTGTELAARGFDVDQPGWSARVLVEDPDLLLQVHRDYIIAGADILTANTFRTHEKNLESWGQPGRSEELTLQAIQIARDAAQGKAYVVSSLAPVGDCYSPEDVPGRKYLIRAHQQMAQYMAKADVDAVLVETHVSCEELVIACEAVKEVGLRVIVSVPITSERTMFDGTSLKQMVASVEKFSPLAVGLNCLPVEEVNFALDEMNQASAFPKIVYANSGRMLANHQWEPTCGANPDQHTELAKSWIQKNVRILGGCCGTTPALIAKFTEQLKP
ncbi:MAG: homocysteine S-methyltransferase family protein [Planctomycetaceae bacterium]|nr:homocysteine S-methyltransferase family protein [Planctomycetaceae bacterium]